ncbi:MAG: FKBP-type peptidyl-prolyl cis-trans isomerase [Acidobacteria bacterium]|nr:FKBP-type peptidyl-prolyl cis-trans isomerase [Acidobacteriota bacterium]
MSWQLRALAMVLVAATTTAATSAAQTPAPRAPDGAADTAPDGAPESAPGSAPEEAPADLSEPPADAVQTDSGLTSRTVTPGTSEERPAPTDFVTVQYTAWSADGTVVDSTWRRGKPSMIALDQSLPGWGECVQMMTVGEIRRCWMPQELAYNGRAGRPTGTIVFDIELIETRPAPTVPPIDVAGPPADATRTVSGLVYKVLKVGAGTRRPSPRSQVTVHYTGWTTDGEMIDSSVARRTPQEFVVNDVIRGWTEGLQLMVEGERRRFWIPENLAYKGEFGAPRGMLVFDIDLIAIE